MTFSANRLKWFMFTVMSHFNEPYLWGGDNPMEGFDCSGLIVDGLRACGIIEPKEDMTADGMWQKWGLSNRVIDPSEGCFAFWMKNGKAYHVAVCLDKRFCLTANAGGSSTTSLQSAIEGDSYITIRPLSHRKTLPLYVNLFLEGRGEV